jgi:hypothetical protein
MVLPAREENAEALDRLRGRAPIGAGVFVGCRKMSAAKRDFKRRLARVETAVSATHPADRQAASHRQGLRALARTCEIIRKRFLLIGLDPALAVSLRGGEDAAAELAAIPDSEALRTADEAMTRTDDCGGARSRVVAEIERMAAFYCGGFQPDLANASVVELLAFTVAIEKLAWGDRCRPLSTESRVA